MKLVRFLSLAFTIATTVASAEQTLHTIEEINRFIADATPRVSPFDLKGKVLSTFRLPETGEIILSGDSGERMQFYRSLDLSQPEAGDTITASGIVRMGDNHEPYARIGDFKVIEHGERGYASAMMAGSPIASLENSSEMLANTILSTQKE